MSTLGQRIRNRRLELDMAQGELAKKESEVKIICYSAW